MFLGPKFVQRVAKAKEEGQQRGTMDVGKPVLSRTQVCLLCTRWIELVPMSKVAGVAYGDFSDIHISSALSVNVF